MDIDSFTHSLSHSFIPSLNPLTDDRDGLGGLRHLVCHQEHEDGDGEQHAEPQRDLLAALGGGGRKPARHSPLRMTHRMMMFMK